jgi:hypothetical protein
MALLWPLFFQPPRAGESKHLSKLLFCIEEEYQGG